MRDSSRKGMLALAERQLNYAKSHLRPVKVTEVQAIHASVRKLFASMNKSVNQSEIEFWNRYIEKYKEQK